MFTTEQLDHLRQEIRDDLAAERIWREVGDIRKAEILNDRVNLKLDRLRRFSAKARQPRENA